MFGTVVRSVSVLGVLMTLLLTGVAGAKSAEVQQVHQTSATKQKAAPEGGVGDIAEASSRLKETQAQLDTTTSGPPLDPDQPPQNPSREPEAQREIATATRAPLDKQLGATHKGEDLEGTNLLPSSPSGGDDNGSGTAANRPARRVVTKGHGNIRFHRGSRRVSKETLRQLAQERGEHEQPREEQQAQVNELQQGETKLEVSVGGSGSKQEQMQARIATEGRRPGRVVRDAAS